MTWPLTPWYPATTKPVRPGVYLVRTEMEWPRETMNLWTGEKWVSIDGIVNLQFLFDAHWRGLAFDPASATENPNIVVSRDGFFDARFPLCGWWVPKP